MHAHRDALPAQHPHRIGRGVAECVAAGERAQEEVNKAKVITTDLANIEKDFAEVQKNCEVIGKNAAESVIGAKEYLQGAAQIAAASEQASSGCTEALKSVEEQAKAYHEMNEAARGLAVQRQLGRVKLRRQAAAGDIYDDAFELDARHAFGGVDGGLDLF